MYDYVLILALLHVTVIHCFGRQLPLLLGSFITIVEPLVRLCKCCWRYMCSVIAHVACYMTFGWELVVLHTIPSMLGDFAVHAKMSCGGLNDEHSTYIGSVRDRLVFGMPRVANMSLALNKPKLFVQIQRLPPSIHHHKG